MSEKNRDAIEIYNLIAEDYSKFFDNITADEDLIFLNTFLKQLPTDSHIIDLGCGTGFSANYFVNEDMFVEGVDLSPAMIMIAQRNYPAINFSLADMRTFRPQRKVEAVWAGYSLFHFEQSDFEKTLEQIKTYLKPGGMLGLVMQEGEGEVEEVQPLLPNKKIYIHLYTETQLKTILKQHGFEVFEVKQKTPMTGEMPYNKLLMIAWLK